MNAHPSLSAPGAIDSIAGEASRCSTETAIASKLPQVLCVDCDRTLIGSDLLQESFRCYAKNRPIRVLQTLWWLLKGKARLKHELAKRVSLSYDILPLNREVLKLVESARASGRRVFLVTAASQLQADRLANHLGVFHGAYGSDEATNLKGMRKAALLTELFGKGGFAYAGDSRADLPVWAAAATAIVVSNSRRLLCQAARVNDNSIRISPQRRSWRCWPQLARVHQWAKNLVLFVPAVTSHRLFERPVLEQSLIAFLSFSLVASSTYILNDLVDLENDRRHPRKKERPLACGSVGIFEGLLAAAAVFAVGALLTLLLPFSFGVTLACYVVLTGFYSVYAKRLMLADSVLLAGLYALRLYAGGTATGIPISTWLLAFSIFIFLSLALAKRLAELRRLSLDKILEQYTLGGRAYRLEDVPVVTALGTSCGVISVLVLVLYTNGADVLMLYSQPKLLLLLAPLLLYWIGRIWMLAQRGELLDDPVLFALRDFRSYLVAALALAIIAAASVLKFGQ